MEKYNFNIRFWIKVALLNFCLVAFAGVVLRYKINFPLPSINQKHLLHAHSHFAFVGWVTLVLMVLMVQYLKTHQVETGYRKYYWMLLVNCISAYGMLVSFALEGYAMYSIFFSILSIIVSYFYIYYLWCDLNKVKDDSYAPKWFKVSLVIWAISSLGAFALAFLMINKFTVLDYYLSATYFFLHFQYNGWFLFVCFGLLFSWLNKAGILKSRIISKKLLFIMAITVGPSFILSIIWLTLPPVLYWIGVASGVIQLLIIYYFVRLFPLIKKKLRNTLSGYARVLWAIASGAFILKIILQLLSVSPSLSQLAFGYRPVLIGYLHLSFLCIISFFVIGYLDQLLRTFQQSISRAGVIIFIFGVLLQEFVLALQGLEAIEFESLPYADFILFASAIIILFGLLIIAIKLLKRVRPLGIK